MNKKELIGKLKQYEDNNEIWMRIKLKGKVMPAEVTTIVKSVIDTVDGLVLSDTELPCCDSPGQDKCEQCQETGLANPLNH